MKITVHKGPRITERRPLLVDVYGDPWVQSLVLFLVRHGIREPDRRYTQVEPWNTITLFWESRGNDNKTPPFHVTLEIEYPSKRAHVVVVFYGPNGETTSLEYPFSLDDDHFYESLSSLVQTLKPWTRFPST